MADASSEALDSRSWTMIDDSLALLIGRALVAYGNLDQTIYEQKHHLGLQRQKRETDAGRKLSDFGHPWEESRLKHRLKELRLLITDLSRDQTLLSAFDNLQTRMSVIERKRAHLAHGRLTERSGGVDVFDARGWVEMGKSWDRAASKYREKGLTERDIFYKIAVKQRNVGDKLTKVWYSSQDIESLVDDIMDANTELKRIIHAAWVIAEKEYSATMFGR